MKKQERKCKCGKMFTPPIHTLIYVRLEECDECFKKRAQKLASMPLSEMMERMGKQVIK